MDEESASEIEEVITEKLDITAGAGGEVSVHIDHVNIIDRTGELVRKMDLEGSDDVE